MNLGAYLRTESGEILLTTLPKRAPQPPESGALPVADEDLGKTALVHGELASKIFYLAQVVETLPRLTGALIQRLTQKGIVSLTEIQERLSELESEQEIGQPEALSMSRTLGLCPNYLKGGYYASFYQ